MVRNKAYELTLPLLTGARGDVAGLVRAARLPVNLSGSEIRVNARSTLAGTPSFADELMRLLLIDRRAAIVIVDGVGASLGDLLFTAAQRHHATDRLIIRTAPFEA